jgi:hypothetical protein
MAVAAIAQVRFEDPSSRADEVLRERIIPLAKAQAGFQSARFMRSVDGSRGIGVVVFDTEANAKAGLERLVNDRPPEAPAVTDSGVYEVIAEV